MLIRYCACGEDHESMPQDELFEGSGLVDLVCLEHKRHIPCRPCIREEIDQKFGQDVPYLEGLRMLP